MIPDLIKDEFKEKFPFILRAGAGFSDAFFADSQYLTLPAQASICEEGEQCTHLAMILEGIGRIYKLSPGGREVTLYRIHSGESCVLTASCMLNQSGFPAMAITETSVRAVLVTPDQVRTWIGREPIWQQFIFGLVAHRLADIISIIEEVAFKRIDVRIAQQLVKAATENTALVRKTHAELAADLGSSREVVSRILKDLSQRGLIHAGRGVINILDARSLRELSQQ